MSSTATRMSSMLGKLAVTCFAESARDSMTALVSKATPATPRNPSESTVTTGANAAAAGGAAVTGAGQQAL
jgi:hypothetical protein